MLCNYQCSLAHVYIFVFISFLGHVYLFVLKNVFTWFYVTIAVPTSAGLFFASPRMMQCRVNVYTLQPSQSVVLTPYVVSTMVTLYTACRSIEDTDPIVDLWRLLYRTVSQAMVGRKVTCLLIHWELNDTLLLPSADNELHVHLCLVACNNHTLTQISSFSALKFSCDRCNDEPAFAWNADYSAQPLTWAFSTASLLKRVPPSWR